MLMENEDDINDYLPSLLNPRGVRKQNASISLTQNSLASRCSLSLKRSNGISSVKKSLHKTFPIGKENEKNNNILKARTTSYKNVANRTPLDCVNVTEGVSLHLSAPQVRVRSPAKKNVQRSVNLSTPNKSRFRGQIDSEEISIGFSAVNDINTEKQDESSPISFGEIEPIQNNVEIDNKESVIIASSVTELGDEHNTTGSTVLYEITEKPILFVSFGVVNCETLNVSTKSGNIKQMCITRKDNGMDVDCEIIECSDVSVESHPDRPEVPRWPDGPTPPKKPAVAINLEIKKTNLTENAKENSKVLILNTDAIERLSHVIVQPPNYKLLKRQILDRRKFKNNGKRDLRSVRNGKSVRGDGDLKQKRLDCYFGKRSELSRVIADDVGVGGCEGMSKNSGVADAVKCERGSARYRGVRREGAGSPKRGARKADSPRAGAPVAGATPAGAPAGVRSSPSEQRAVLRSRNDSAGSAPSHRKNADATPFTMSAKTATNKTAIPYYKIVAGTHFAVDAFSYGDIPNVNHYFLTHFHSDHYSGLKKSFNKLLFCSQITSDLCQTRLGVSPKNIRVINFDETITVEGVEVTAVDANHCPGALMLVFTLPNGKTLLHTGDFRASPQMESYPVFWNRDIHTIYLDSTYCNPRYDFPTQEESLEMALYHLRQKKLAVEKAGKKFSSVLIVCGTYTIGKEKFFLGMARRVGCSVWACPEKDKVLQAVEGRSFCGAAPALCQLHVVPMRELTHEKLRTYLESLGGDFTEVVAFKPSGWENGKNSSIEKYNVTIHGIPYSEHSSFSEMIRFVKFLNPKQVVPTVDISGGVKAVQKYFPCPLVCKEDTHNQSKVTDYFSIQHRQQSSAVT